MPLRVIHVVAPAFGYTFSGPTRRMLRLFQEWSVPEIEFAVWGTDYFGLATEDRKLWSKPVRHTRKVRMLWSLRLIWMLFRHRRDYDLVHVHTLWIGGLLVPLVTRLLGKKAIYHMTLLGSDNPSAVRAQSLGRIKLDLLKKYDGLIGLTPALIHDCEQNRYKAKLVTLPNPLSFHEDFNEAVLRTKARSGLGIPSNADVLLYAGSVIARKGVDILVEMFIRLAEKRPNLWLLVLGPYTKLENPRLDENFPAALQQSLTQACLSKRVIWAGLVRDEMALVSKYVASDVFVFPTRAEGQGNVILEAMGCGLPVVCSHLPGVTDVMVVPNDTGYLVDVDDLDGFIAATTRLLDNPTLCHKMGEAGRKRAVADFGFEAYCHKLAGFYRRVASDKSN